MRTFAITWDYRCPFARNANEFVVDALLGGADWDVTFVPFSLGQVHVADGETPVWDRPADDSGLLALQVGTAVRDIDPQRFPDVHRDLFALRHDLGGNLRDADRLREIVTRHEVDAGAVFTHVADGRALKAVSEAHEAAAAEHDVWGVPTLICGDRAVFVRLMHRSDGDAGTAAATVERLLDLMDGFVDLNEFKHTRIPR
ncbi:MAG TPA: DsbA family protein [Euzebyales bacterium]